MVRIDSPARIEFVDQYRLNEMDLSESQRSKAKKMIHNVISKKPVSCEECHTKENSLLPLVNLGYPKRRVDSITSTEVVGMIKNYTQFYMPKMLNPGGGKPVTLIKQPDSPQQAPPTLKVEEQPAVIQTEG